MAAFADNYTGAVGATIYGGRAAPPPPAPTGMPLWAADAEMHKPLAIPNSSGAGGSRVEVFGGYAINQVTGEIYSFCQGGHGDSSDNRGVSFPLRDDNPAGWRLRIAASAVGDRIPDAAYYLDGKPTSRHTYDNTLWIPQVNRIMFVGVRGAYGNGNSYGAIDGFNPDTDTWDPAGTWVNTINAGAGLDPTRGRVWMNDWRVFDAVTNSISTPISTHPIPVRFPIIHDPVRDIMFALMWGANLSGSGSAFNSSKWNADGTGIQVAVTYNDSPAYTQFQADRLSSAGGQPSDCSAMTYDKVNDCFYWYNGRLDNANRLYKIIPNSGTVWDMEIFAWASGSTPMPSVSSAGMNGRLKYIDALKGFIICPSGNGVIYFVRTS